MRQPCGWLPNFGLFADSGDAQSYAKDETGGLPSYAPAFMANIDRARATQLGLNAQSIANNINISLTSSEQVTPNFWTDPASGIPNYIAASSPDVPPKAP
jgi:hypothetical protein